MALFWKTITRAKLPFLQPALSREAIMACAVNTRKTLEPPLPDRFPGNAVALPRVSIGYVEELVRAGDDNLPQLAAAVRESIRTITPQYAVEQHGFGSELPKAMRWPHPQFEGYLFVLPSRAAVKRNISGSIAGGNNDEGSEICVCLDEICKNRLLQDAELLRLAQPRGLDA